MKKPDTWMPLYVGDYLRDTTRFSTEQHGAYMLLIFDYWMSGAPPDDDTTLAQIVKLPLARWKAIAAPVKAKFRIVDGVLRHKRIDEELASAIKAVEAASEKGRAGATARWHRHSTGNATGIPPANAAGNTTSNGEGNASSPSPSSKGRGNTKRVAAPPLPEWLPLEVWQAWARHRGRKLTPEAATLQIGKLDSLRNLGHDVAKLVQLAIESGWATFYPPKGSDRGVATTQRAATATAMYGGTAEHARREIDVTPDVRAIPAEVKRVA